MTHDEIQLAGAKWGADISSEVAAAIVRISGSFHGGATALLLLVIEHARATQQPLTTELVKEVVVTVLGNSGVSVPTMIRAFGESSNSES